MRLSLRWRKILRDFETIRSRVVMMVAAIAVGVLAVTAISSATAILTREIERNYLDTNPASILIDVGEVPDGLVERLRQDPDLQAVEAVTIVTARAETHPGEWTRLLLFVASDLRTLAVSKVFPQAGAWPPAPGTILLEREALSFLNRQIGDTLTLRLPGGEPVHLPISGAVHDPSLAPAWQEQTIYGYLPFETYSALGGAARPELLKLVVRDGVHDQARVDQVAARIANELKGQGLSVHQLQVPPTGRHPHQTQMTAILAMFLIFALLGLVLSAILTASMIDGLLAAQVRQIAVMKAIGARSGQVARIYLGGVAAIASLAVAIGLPLGLLGGSGFADVIAALLNFDIASHAVPPLLVGALVAGGLAIPLAFAFLPIRSALKRTIREALADYGVADGTFEAGRIDRILARFGGIDRTLILALRNAFRRRRRLLLTVGLLSVAGALFVASLGVQSAWDGFVAASAGDRHYDMELRLDVVTAAKTLRTSLEAVPGVERVESWPAVPAAPARDDGLLFMRTYPDGGHGSLELRAVPAADSLAHLKVMEGSGATLADAEAVVLNQGAHALIGYPAVGTTVALSADGRTVRYRVAGIVREILTLPAAYVTRQGFATATSEPDGTPDGTNVLRVAATTHDAASVARLATEIEVRLAGAGYHVTASLTEAQVSGAGGGHVRIMVVTLMVLSGLMAVVGLLGLASAQGANVAERTREFGVMRTIGATSAVVVRNVIAEGVTIALLSLAPTVALGLPLAYGIGALVGRLAFGLPLPLDFPIVALIVWTAIILVGAMAASAVPARAAARLTIRQTLACS